MAPAAGSAGTDGRGGGTSVGIDESFTAQMIVSDTDIAADIPGTQTLWVQGVGCGAASVQFNR